MAIKYAPNGGWFPQWACSIQQTTNTSTIIHSESGGSANKQYMFMALGKA